MSKESGIYIDLDKKLYKEVRKFCVDNDMKIKEFFEYAIYTELELRGANYGKKSIKSNRR